MANIPDEDGTPEKVIALLKFLVAQCGTHGLPDYGQIIDEAAEECLKLMLNNGPDSPPGTPLPN